MWRVWRETRGARVLEARRERREALPVRARRDGQGERRERQGARQGARRGERRGEIRERRASLIERDWRAL